MIPITLKGLAKFMTATPANQRKILKDFKYPKEEGYAQALYYREARDLIYSLYKHNHPSAWLAERATQLRGLATATGGQSGGRLSHNARGVDQYLAHFSGRRFEVLKDLDLSVSLSGVRIKINPDLHVREGGKEKIIKLEFSAREPEERLVRIVCQTMFEGASANGHPLTASCVLYLDVPRGAEHRGARAGARMRAEIDAACQNIASLWDRI